MPTLGKTVPAGENWFHEVKYDGYRRRVERDGDRVRLITMGGNDWTKRYPWIVEAALLPGRYLRGAARSCGARMDSVPRAASSSA
ncbi:hypothetical protein [Bradyrhizobium jicamae]|uniref:hypothetical protein n=1 Tax=Bradyrhizobium jicamae TaxID=280332 RepID=UPI001BA5C7E2|nr:hypothetical protein [Bradyrhizobium jicamae]MBR0939406.1 hypothetical protein [Bradyrhizobium jicamae]